MNKCICAEDESIFCRVCHQSFRIPSGDCLTNTKCEKFARIPKRTRTTFRKIMDMAYTMHVIASTALSEVHEKKRDKLMDRIINFNEKIEKLYTTNWH